VGTASNDRYEDYDDIPAYDESNKLSQKPDAIRQRRWRENNYEQCRRRRIIDNQRTRARRYGVEGDFTWEEWEALCNEFDNRCVSCRKVEPLQIDHIIPLSTEGSTNTIDNIQPLCGFCNKVKRDQIIDYRAGIKIQ
jgi:5-methylcytosine-specific restriction endonuclease McrA